MCVYAPLIFSAIRLWRPFTLLPCLAVVNSAAVNTVLRVFPVMVFSGYAHRAVADSRGSPVFSFFGFLIHI